MNHIYLIINVLTVVGSYLLRVGKHRDTPTQSLVQLKKYSFEYGHD